MGVYIYILTHTSVCEKGFGVSTESMLNRTPDSKQQKIWLLLYPYACFKYICATQKHSVITQHCITEFFAIVNLSQ